jgi:hypothetical protein
MTVSCAVAELVPDAQRWRRHLHAHPELFYDLDQTAAFVAERLREFGCDDVRTGVGRSGVVGVIKATATAPVCIIPNTTSTTPRCLTASPISPGSSKQLSPPRAVDAWLESALWAPSS